MGKIKNFRVNLPYEYARDKKWIDDNLKPGDVDQYRVFKGSLRISGVLTFPDPLYALLDRLEENQNRIEGRIHRLFSLLREGEDQTSEEE